MTAKWNKKDAVTGELTFEIDQDQIKTGLDKAFNRVKGNITVPGFRKGKVSRTIFNKMYGETALYEDALNDIFPEAYEAAVAEAGIEPVDQPQVSIESMEPGKNWEIKTTVTVKPEVKLGEYKGVAIPKQNKRVYAADVDKEIEEKRQQMAELVVSEDAAKKGDTVVIDYNGTIDGKEFDGGSAKNYSLELGSGSFIPGFEDQLEGHKAGEDVTVKVTFPEDYQSKEVAGKDAEFATTIHEVKVKELPELDDEFAKDVDEDVDSLDDLKKKVREDLKAKKANEVQEANEQAALKVAVDNATIETIPDAMIQTEIQQQMDQFFGNMQRQGINQEMYFKLTGTTEQQMRDQFAGNAETRVKTNLVLEAIVAAENIEASDDEIANEVKSLASDYGMEETAVRNALSDDMLVHDISMQKAIALIRDSAVEEKKDDKKSDD
ncbi:trigger factor [Lacticaseibacillus songhuajiangensis]|jgi:trigger factor|uniref:trigger factor n=1 Tax=Lacticaseibacillus songhuajiangensis TaxID=1296539 RepID=UPI000F7811EF|nr:trigger factor [Lacticaseibacillus songhuajiangensis]MCI1283076.1 trigger factor [Lacticaseibacillus songhuajiangensis]